MMSKPQIPPFQHYFAPILEQLDKLGGSATIQELEEHVADAMGLSNAQTSMLQAPERGNQTAVGYRMAWARTYLKKMGYIDNSERGVWSLTAKGRDADILNPKEIVQAVQAGYAQDGNDSEAPIELDEDEAVTPGQPDWRAELFQMLHALPPEASGVWSVMQHDQLVGGDGEQCVRLALVVGELHLEMIVREQFDDRADLDDVPAEIVSDTWSK